MKLSKSIAGGCVAFVTSFSASAGYASDQDIIDAGNFLQWGLPLTGYLGTWIAGDKEGAILFTKSLATTVVATSIGKDTAQKFRPQATSTKSFPSGHTSAAFSGAAFIDSRYGHGFGIPAYALAAFTGYSRIVADAHHVDDVMAGASVALFSNWYWVRPSGQFNVTPVAVDGGAAIVLSVNDGKQQKDYSTGNIVYPRYRYALEFGPAALQRNTVRSPGGSGTEFNLYDFARNNDPTTTANANLQVILSPKNMLTLQVLPFEARDGGQFSTPVNFAGANFPANTDVFSAHRITDVRLRYDYTLFDVADFRLTGGASLAFQRTIVELTNSDGSLAARADDEAWLPLLNANLTYSLSRKTSVYTDISGTSISDYEMIHGSVGIGYQIDRYWDFAFGVGIYDRLIETSELTNDVRYDISYFTLGYTF